MKVASQGLLQLRRLWLCNHNKLLLLEVAEQVCAPPDLMNLSPRDNELWTSNLCWVYSTEENKVLKYKHLRSGTLNIGWVAAKYQKKTFFKIFFIVKSALYDFWFNILFLLRVFPSSFIVTEKGRCYMKWSLGLSQKGARGNCNYNFVECCLCCSFLWLLPHFIAINMVSEVDKFKKQIH